MNHLVTILLLTSFMLGSSALSAQSQCRIDMPETRHLQVTNEGWQIQNDQDNIKIYNRKIPGSDIREVLALTTINFPALRLFDTVSDYAHYKDFMPYVQKSEVLPPIQDHKIRISQELNFPWPISNRYYTIELTADTTQAHLANYAVSWTLSPEEIPEDKGVQLKINDGYWLFCTVEENRTFVEYYIHTDPGGILPLWAVNLANTKAVPEVINAVQHRAASKAYDR